MSSKHGDYLSAAVWTAIAAFSCALVDAMIRDGLWEVYNNVHMGTCGDRCAEKYNFTRQQQDDFAVTSFKRALEAAAKGFFAREIEPVKVKAGKDTIAVTEDETPK